MNLEKLAQAKSLMEKIDRSYSKLRYWEKKMESIKSVNVSVMDMVPSSTRTEKKILQICIDDEKENIRNLEHSFSVL